MKSNFPCIFSLAIITTLTCAGCAQWQGMMTSHKERDAQAEERKRLSKTEDVTATSVAAVPGPAPAAVAKPMKPEPAAQKTGVVMTAPRGVTMLLSVKIEDIDLKQMARKLASEDALKENLFVRLRYYRETEWFLNESLSFTDAKDDDLLIEKTIKVDPEKPVECHFLAPTKNGKWLKAVTVASSYEDFTERKKFKCETRGSWLALSDSTKHEWPAIGSQLKAQTGYKLDFISSRRELSKHRDEIALTGTQYRIQVSFTERDSAKEVASGEIRVVSRTGRFSSSLFTNSDTIGLFPVKEGVPLAYRLSIKTKKGNELVAVGEATPWTHFGGGVATLSVLASSFKYNTL